MGIVFFKFLSVNGGLFVGVFVLIILLFSLLILLVGLIFFLFFLVVLFIIKFKNVLVKLNNDLERYDVNKCKLKKI